MSEAKTYSSVSVLGAGILGKSAQVEAHTSTASKGAARLKVTLEAHISAASKGAAMLRVPLSQYESASSTTLAGYRADVPHIANVTYQLQADGGVNIPAVLVYVRQRKNATTALEIHTVGRISKNQWALDLIGKELSMRQIASRVNGDIISADVLLTAIIDNVVQVSGGVKIFATEHTPHRVSQRVKVADVLYIQQRSNGRRSVRCPVSWDVQAGDVIYGSDLPDLEIETLTMTISRQYRTMDITEVA